MNKNRVLIKIGGQAFSDKSGFEELAAAIKSIDAEVIIVHGGGAEISKALKETKRETVFVDGVRVTQKQDVEIVESVLSETVNGRIAAYLSESGIECVRLSGKSSASEDSGALLIAKKTLRNGNDIGYVGEIVRVNPGIVWEAISQKRVPVVSPISANENGVTLNVNADTAAAALAVGSKCTDLVYFSDVPGVMDEKNEVLPYLSAQAGSFLIQTGIITGGMVAKLESIFDAVSRGVERVHITQWQGATTLKHLLDGRDITKTTIHK